MDFGAVRSAILCNDIVETKGASAVDSSRENKKHYHGTENID